jgi:pSer/pThr/pTyr-binding forkhead associated (FHA) protein
MNTNPENTNQQLNRVRYQRAALQGVLNYRLSPPSLDQCRIPGFNPNDSSRIWQCTQQILKYASEENFLRQRVKRKAQIASGQPIPVSTWQLRSPLSGDESVVFSIVEAISITGRDDECELVLPLPHISRKHVVLTPQPDGLRIRDLDSTNGTRVNGVLVQEAVLHHGDTLTIAGLTLVLEYCGPMEGVFVA